MKFNWLTFSIFLFIAQSAMAQNVVLPLWEDAIPNNKITNETERRDTTDAIRISNVQRPEMAVFLPEAEKATGQAVIIFPGGGYRRLVYDKEGSIIAQLLNEYGIAAAVVKYRLPVSTNNIVRYESPLLDAKRAVRLLRHQAEKWDIDPNNVGVMGFSAGGHLAATLATQFDFGDPSTGDSIDAISSRPDFVMLIYPVITLSQAFMHRGSRDNLLGASPDSALVKRFSAEFQVKTDTPPTLLIHSGNDKSVPVENSLVFYKALLEKGVSAEMHLYPEGGHGFALTERIENSTLKTWPMRCIEWLKWCAGRSRGSR